MENVVMGFKGEGSAWDRGSYLYRLSMPLFVPTETWVLTYSHRLVSGTTKFYADSPDAILAAIDDSLARSMSETEELERFADGGRDGGNRLNSEVGAYANLRLGDVRGARKQLRLAQAPRVSRSWETEVIERARHVQRLLDGGGLESALGQLDAWTAQTRSFFTLEGR